MIGLFRNDLMAAAAGKDAVAGTSQNCIRWARDTSCHQSGTGQPPVRPWDNSQVGSVEYY